MIPTNLEGDIIKPRLPGQMRQLAKYVPNGSKLLFGDDLNKYHTDQNTKNALLSKPVTLLYHTILQQIKRTGIAVVKTQHINFIQTAINVQKTCIPPGIALKP